LSDIGVAGFELELHLIAAVADVAVRLLDAQFLVNRKRQLFGHFLALVGAEVENDGDFFFAAFAGDLAGEATEAFKVNNDTFTDDRERGSGEADVARRNVGRAAIVLAAEVIQEPARNGERHAAEAAALADADLSRSEAAGGGGEIDLGCS